MNILRINRGVPREVFKNRTGLSYAIIEPSLVKLKRRLLIEDLDEVICSTHKGRLFLNSVLEYF